MTTIQDITKPIDASEHWGNLMDKDEKGVLLTHIQVQVMIDESIRRFHNGMERRGEIKVPEYYISDEEI